MTLHPILLILLSLSLLGLAIWLIKRYQPSSLTRYYVGFLFGLATIAGVHGLIFLSINGPVELLTLLDKFGYLGGVITFSMLLQFSFYYPIPSAKIPNRSELLWIVPLVFFIPYFLLSEIAIQQAMELNGGVKEIYGPGFFIFPLFVITYVIWTIINLVKKIKITQGPEQRNTRLFIIVLILATLAGVIFDVVIPALGNTRQPIGIYTSGILFGLSVFIITRK